MRNRISIGSWSVCSRPRRRRSQPTASRSLDRPLRRARLSAKAVSTKPAQRAKSDLLAASNQL